MSDRRNYDRKQSSSSSRHGDAPSTQPSSGQYDYLTKMYQPPKGTKFATARTKNEMSKYEASKQESNLSSSASFLTPGVKEELKRLEQTQSIQNYGRQSSSSSKSRDEREIVDLDGAECSQGSSEKGSSRRHSERSYSVNSQTSQGSQSSSKSKEKRRSRSRSTERSSGSSRKGESSTGSNNRTSDNRKASGLHRRGSEASYVAGGHRHSSDRPRSRSRSRSKGNKDRDYRKEVYYKNDRNRGGNFRRPFNNYRGRGGGHHQRGGRNPNFQQNQNSGRPWNIRTNNNKDNGSRNEQEQESQSTSKVTSEGQNQSQFPNMHGLQVIEKLNKLNMIPQLLKTAQIYETKIEPIEQAKLKERQKLSLIQPKSADETAIARTLESNLICVKNLKDVTSQKRLTSLVCTMRYYLNQMNVEMKFHNKYFEEYLVDFCASMGWDPITAEAALTLDVKENSDALKDFSYQPDEHFKCNKCSLSYPSCKFSCITCRQLFTCLPEVFAHEYTNHGKLVQPSFTCFVCQKYFGTDPVAFSTHFTLEHVCAVGHSECAIGCKSLIVGSSYLELENHNASQHNCKVCGDLVGSSLRHHLEFFHSSMKPSDYLPEVYFEPVVDEELAKLHELLENIADVKRENPQLFEELEDVKSEITATELDTSTYEHQTSSSSIQSISESMTLSDPLQNIHRFLTTNEKIPLTSLTGNGGLLSSDDSSANLSDTVIDISGNEDESCLYLDTSRDPRLKSEFYKSATFFSNLNHSLSDSGIVDESNLEERLFHPDKNLTPWRSNGVQYDFEILKYKTAEVFQDIFQTNENQIKPIPVQKEDSLRNRLYPLPQKISRTSKYQQEESLTVEPEANPIFRRSTSGNESSSLTSNSSFITLSKPIPEPIISPKRTVADVTTTKATPEWDPRFDRIIHEFGDPQPRLSTFQSSSTSSNSNNVNSSGSNISSNLSKSQIRETIPKFGVDFSRSPEKLTEQIASSQNRHVGKERERDPRLKRNAGQIASESSSANMLSDAPNYQTHVENSTECERKRMEQTMAFYLAIQKP